MFYPQKGKFIVEKALMYHWVYFNGKHGEHTCQQYLKTKKGISVFYDLISLFSEHTHIYFLLKSYLGTFFFYFMVSQLIFGCILKFNINFMFFKIFEQFAIHVAYTFSSSLDLSLMFSFLIWTIYTPVLHSQFRTLHLIV